MNVDLDVACSNWPYALNSRIKCIIYIYIYKFNLHKYDAATHNRNNLIFSYLSVSLLF